MDKSLHSLGSDEKVQQGQVNKELQEGRQQFLSSTNKSEEVLESTRDRGNWTTMRTRSGKDSRFGCGNKKRGSQLVPFLFSWL